MSNMPPPGGGEVPTGPPSSGPFVPPPPSQPVHQQPQHLHQQPMAPPGYQSYGPSGMVPAAPKSGKLLAGGIVAVVLSAFIILIGVVVALLGDAINDFADDFGNAIVLIGLAMAAFGGFGLAAGIGAIRRRQWGRISSIVFGAINGAFGLLSLADQPDGGTVVYLGMSIAIVVLCSIGPATA